MTTSFKAQLKGPNRDFLNTLKIRFRVRSAAAALNRLLDQERQTANRTSIHFVICGGCKTEVPTVNTNRYVVCHKCHDVFTPDGQVRWYLPQKGDKKK